MRADTIHAIRIRTALAASEQAKREGDMETAMQQANSVIN